MSDDPSKPTLPTELTEAVPRSIVERSRPDAPMPVAVVDPPAVTATHRYSSDEVAKRFEEFFEPEEGGTLEEDPNAFKVGLLGGKGVGKSYLFQSMVYRILGRDAGALSQYLARSNVHVYGRRIGSASADLDTKFRSVRPHILIRDYERWDRLVSTQAELQMWYRLYLPLRTGWLGRRRSEMDVRFLDGSGDRFQSGIQTEEERKLWSEAFVDASVMVLCLPMWAAFPNRAQFTDPDWVARDEFLTHFGDVVYTYETLRRASGASHKVQVILALTQADSPLCEPTARAAWITPYVRNPVRYLRAVRSGAGVARYLASARQVSNYLTSLCEESPEQKISKLLNLDYGHGSPWMVPLTAIDGEQLQRVDDGGWSDTARIRLEPPVPAHVELPLLIALCEQHNALA